MKITILASGEAQVTLTMKEHRQVHAIIWQASRGRPPVHPEYVKTFLAGWEKAWDEAGSNRDGGK